MKLRHLITLFIMLILASCLAFYFGKSQGTTSVTNIATNEVLISQISELAALEVQGNAQIDKTNIKNDGSLTDAFRKMVNEQSIHLNIPYIAKYGVKIDSANFNIQVNGDKSILIQLPEPLLLSFEMRLDKAMQSSKEGWLQSQNYETFNKAQKQLYEQSRAQSAASEKNKSLAKEKIISILKNYYKPLGLNVQIQFGDEKSLKLLD